MHRESIETVYNSPSLGGKGIKGSEYNGKKIKQRGREEKGKGRQRKVAKAGNRGKGSKKVQEKVRKRFYVVLKIEKMWGRKSNAKLKGGGKESKVIEQYTPLQYIGQLYNESNSFK